MQYIEEDSYGELSIIMAAIREADTHALVHGKAAAFHQIAMEDAKKLAAKANQWGETQRQLYRDTMEKFASIFATEAARAQRELAETQDNNRRGDSAALSVEQQTTSAPKLEQMKQEEARENVDGARRESSDVRVREWRLQASAVSVAEDDVPDNSVAMNPIQSNQSSGTYGPPPYASSSRPVPLPSQAKHASPLRQGLANTASCNDLSRGRPPARRRPVRITDANGSVIDFGPPADRMSMRSAPEVPSTSTEHKTHAMKSREASKQAYEILAAQIKRSEDEEKRRREQAGSFVGGMSETAFR